MEIRKIYFKRELIEGVLVFSLIVIGLIFETYNRGLLFQNNTLNFEVIKFILYKSFISTLPFVIGYSLVKNRIFVLYDNVRTTFLRKVGENQTIIVVLYDAFIILGIILSIVPIKPILQETFKESNIINFKYVFVRYDEISSVILLLLIAIPLIFFIIKYIQGKKRFFYITPILLIIIFIGIINNGPNFLEKISKTRASWVTKDWNTQEEYAQKALQDANSDEERMEAYYWLGVSENRKGNYSKAIEYQLEAIKLDPTFAASYASLANAYLGNKEYKKSFENSNKCVDYDPKYAWCYQALGGYYLETGDVDNALTYVCKASELDIKNRELAQECKAISDYKKSLPLKD